MIKLFTFSSNSINNIQIGYRNRLWAVPISTDPSHNKRNKTLSDNVHVGSFGWCYCSEDKRFYNPFLIVERPQDRNVKDIWEGVWTLPFKVFPLSNIDSSLSISNVEQCLIATLGKKQWHHVIHIQGTTTFVPTDVDDQEFGKILVSFGIRES